jgi:hypothetical protein
VFNKERLPLWGTTILGSHKLSIGLMSRRRCLWSNAWIGISLKFREGMRAWADDSESFEAPWGPQAWKSKGLARRPPAFGKAMTRD